MGLTQEAYSYMIEIKNTISFIGARTAVIQGGSGGNGHGGSGDQRGRAAGGPKQGQMPPSLVDKVLDQRFKHALDLFSDRLTMTLKATSTNKAATAAEYDAALSAGAATSAIAGSALVACGVL